MKKAVNLIVMAVTALSVATAFAQDAVRSSSSMNLPLCDKADVTIPFAINGEGKRFAPTWGLDQAWINEQNLRKGINHMGKTNIGIGRTAFRYSQALTNDSVLGSNDIAAMRSRNNVFDLLDKKLPLVITADQEAVNPETTDGPPAYFVNNKQANIEHWAAMINSHVHWMQANTSHPIVGISPFNEGDYWTTEEGATVAKQWQVAKLLKEQYPRCADIKMVGGNTLNNDKALEWYSSGKQYYDWGNTHQLAGSFDNFAKFYQQLAADGKVGYADEMHNVGEAMIGLEYGMTVGIWWGFDSRARGEFCQISRHGERLAYGEHRNNWTAASVYRHDDGPVKAFIGSSERQAASTTYQFVSTEREVYYDGHGPSYEFAMNIPGGNGYQKGQTNAERVIDITWGADVPPSVINGTYKIINALSGSALVCGGHGSRITQAKYSGDITQQFNVRLCKPTCGGDYSFYDIERADNPKLRMNVKNYSTFAGVELIAWTQDNPTSNEQWYLEYAGNGYYFIRNRESALYLSVAGSSATADIVQDTKNIRTPKRQMWRFVPVDIDYETTAPKAPKGLTAQQAPASVRLEWTANGETDLDGYMILRADRQTLTWNTIARKVKTNYYVDNTCRAGQSYYYRVRAIDRAENISSLSDSVFAAPTARRSLIAHWSMNETVYDATPNMMDAAVNGTEAITLMDAQRVQRR